MKYLEKPQNCQNWGVGPYLEMEACSGQYGNDVAPSTYKSVEVGHNEQQMATDYSYKTVLSQELYLSFFDK